MNLTEKIKSLLLRAIVRKGFDKQQIILYVREFLNPDELKLVFGFLNSISGEYDRDNIESLWKKFAMEREKEKEKVIGKEEANTTAQLYAIQIGVVCGNYKFHTNLQLKAISASKAFDKAEKIIEDWHFTINKVEKKGRIEKAGGLIV